MELCILDHGPVQMVGYGMTLRRITHSQVHPTSLEPLATAAPQSFLWPAGARASAALGPFGALETSVTESRELM